MAGLLRTIVRRPVATSYALLLAGSSLTLSVLPHADRDRVLLYLSTNLDNLHDHPVRALLLSALVLAQGGLPWAVAVVAAVTAVEGWLGSLAAAALAVAGNVAATLVTAEFIRHGLRTGLYPPQVRSGLDYGVSYVVFFLAGTLTARWSTLAGRLLWCAAIAAALISVGSATAVPEEFVGVGHLVSAGLGLGTGLALLFLRGPQPRLGGGRLERMSGMDAHAMFSDVPRGQVVGQYDTYLEAQRAVDFLSDEGFPVQHLAIVGSGLRMVENVTGRLTRGKAVGAGAGSGAWFGLFIGLLLGIFGGNGVSTLGVIVAGVLYGVLFGAIFGLVSYQLTGGKRDFTSRSKIVSSSYEIICKWAEADRAREVLTRLTPG